MSASETVKRKLLAKSDHSSGSPIKPDEWLSTGSTLLNLACSGRRGGGLAKGRYFFFVGDSDSGKTVLVLTILAEAGLNKHFKGYRFIYDDIEGGALMNIEQFFGKEVARRLEAPGKNGEPSTTVEELYDNLDDAYRQGKPFIYIVDSMDGLSCEADDAKFEEQKLARRKGRQVAGSFGAEKAKKNSAGLRKARKWLKKTGSILIIISQTRDNLGMSFDPKTRSGGRALKFYAALEMWSSIRQKLYRTVKGKKRQVGILCQMRIKKNRLTGKDRTVEFPIYWSVGIDDIGGCCDFLVQEGVWKGPKKGEGKAPIQAGKFGKAPREKLVKLIEDKGLEGEVRKLVADIWNEIEQACRIERKRRYA